MTRAKGFLAIGSVTLAMMVGCNEPAADSDAPTAPTADVSSKKTSPSIPPGSQKPETIATKSAAAIENAVTEAPKSATVPENVLWLMPDKKLIKDEPLEVAVPPGYPALTTGVNVPVANPITKGKYELGKQLYFDARVSKDGTVSCATCHNPFKGWTDNAPVSTGIKGRTGGRSAPTVLNTVYGRTMFWDGRAPSLEGQAQGPVQNVVEMGDQTYKEIVERLRKIDGYVEQFQRVFGTTVTLDGMAKAIATFERTVITGNSPYDKYFAGDMKALSDSQKRGTVLFGLELHPDDEFKPGVVKKKANCTACHVGFNFTNEQFHNLGVGFDPKTGEFKDLGRFTIDAVGAKSLEDIGAFKTPTLRNIATTGPYMHDGSLKTLADVVEHYNKGGEANPYLDKDMKKLELTDQEKKDVVAFMESLTGELVMKVELPTLPKGPDGKSPNPNDALTPPSGGTALADPHAIFVR